VAIGPAENFRALSAARALVSIELNARICHGGPCASPANFCMFTNANFYSRRALGHDRSYKLFSQRNQRNRATHETTKSEKEVISHREGTGAIPSRGRNFSPLE